MKARVSKKAEKFFNENPKNARELLKNIANNPEKIKNHEEIETNGFKVKQI